MMCRSGVEYVHTFELVLYCSRALMDEASVSDEKLRMRYRIVDVYTTLSLS